MLVFSDEKSEWGMAAALCPRQSGTARTCKVGKRWDWPLKRVWGIAAALHPRQSGTDGTGSRWKRTFKTGTQNVKSSKPSASWETGTGLNDRVFMQALWPFLPKNGSSDFSKKALPPQAKRFSETLADFAKFLMALINNRLCRFIAYMLITHVTSGRLSLLRSFNAICYITNFYRYNIYSA